MAPIAGMQASDPEKVDLAIAAVKGHDYFRDGYVAPDEVVTEIDPRDKVC